MVSLVLQKNAGSWVRAATSVVEKQCVKACSQINGNKMVSRPQSTSTMDLVSQDESSRFANTYGSLPLRSTLQIGGEQRYNTFSSVASQRRESGLTAEQWHELVSVKNDNENTWNDENAVEAQELSLAEAGLHRNKYDKILLLLNHGEDESQTLIENDTNVDDEEDEEPPTDSLTRRGIGQSLNLSRRTAAYCNSDTQLVPDLFVVGATRKVLQTTFLSFPYDTPHTSLTATPWICHPSIAAETTDDRVQYTSPASMLREFPGVDYSLMMEEETSTTNNENSADDVLSWLQTRNERIVVVSGDTDWLFKFGQRLGYTGCLHNFESGEIRSIGVHFW